MRKNTNVYLHLRNPINHSEKLELKMDVFDFDLAHRWLQELKASLLSNLHMEKTFCFLGFLDTPRNVSFLCRELNRHIQRINEFAEAGGFGRPYHIELEFSPEKVVQNEILNQEFMNDLHHHFAVLFGQVWNYSRYYLDASEPVKQSIIRLNYLCHEMENLVEQQKYARIIGEDNIGPSTIVSYRQCPRKDLRDEDYEHFKFQHEFGGVYLHYAQVGKRWDEAYEDRDKVAANEEISGLRYYSGEFDVMWGNYDPHSYAERLSAIKGWLKSLGKDPEDKKLSLGFVQVGRFNRLENFGELRGAEIHQLISRHADIESIRVVEGDGTETTCFYPYTSLSED